jgi:hypothetical protein
MDLEELLWLARDQGETLSADEMNALIDAGMAGQDEWWENEDLTYSWTDPEDSQL